jgi:predicted nucleic acid-binding protein
LIVADTNLLVYLLVPGPLTPRAERVRAKEKVWVVPPLLRHEFLNVLARHMRHGDIDRDEAVRAFRRGLSMVEVSLARPDPLDVLKMSEQSGCSTYDVEFVWLAMELDLPLVTADREVVDAFPDVARDLSHYA